jgi:hypothetical protein
MALQFDLVRAIVEHGSQTPSGDVVDPSANAELRAAGVAVVATYVEQLALLGIVTDPEPMFGAEGGMWIGYRLTADGRALASSEHDLRRAVAPLIGGPRTEVSEAVAELLAEAEAAGVNELYRDDFLKTLDEIRICFDEECFIASIVLSGKILEVCLREILLRHGMQMDPNATTGALIKAVRERVPGEYIDPALGNVANIVNTSRNAAVHAHERVPVPSRDQAVSVIFAMRDVVRRNLSHAQGNGIR